MKISSVLFSLLTVFFAGQARAQLVLPAGTYQSTDGCLLSIVRQPDGRTSIRMLKGAAAVSAEFRNPIVSRTEQVLSIGACSGKTQYKIANDDSIATTYLTRCGGFWNSVDYKLYWAVSQNERDLIAFRAEGLGIALTCQRFSRAR